MATVYLAHDLRHDRPVALKVLHPELAQALGSERFLREIKRVLTPDGFCLITTPNRRLFSPSGPSGNVHHLSEMDVTTYAATAGRVFPRVEIRGIPQRSLTLHPDQSMPSARPNAEIRPEDYRVQKTDVEQCENLLCFAHADPAGSFAHSLPAALEPVADELAPLFWDPTSCAWVVLGIHPDGPLATVPLRLGQEVRVSFRSPYGDLYRVELDTVGSLDVPVRVTLRDADGRLVAAGEVEPEQDRVVVAFAPQPASRDRAYTLAIRLQFGAGVLRHLFAPAQLAGRIVSDRVGIAIRTFHARHSAGSSPGSPFGSAEKGPRAALRCSPDGGP
jgi:hypothetical protein